VTIRDIAVSFGYDVDKASEKKASASIQSLKSAATKLLGAIGIGFSLKKLNGLSEEFGAIGNKIRDATRGMGDQAEIQDTILKQANDARQSFGDMADTVGKLAQNTDLFSSVDDASEFAGLLYKNFKAAGQSASEADGNVKQLTNSISRGAFDSRAMLNVLQNSPSTFRMIADSMGVSTDALRDMASKGKVSAATLRDAFLKNSGEIEKRFGEVDMTISDAMLNIRSEWGKFISDTDKTFKLTKTIAQTMVKGFNKVLGVLRKMRDMVVRVADKFGGFRNMLKFIGIVAGTLFAAFNFGKIIKFVKTLSSTLGVTSAKMLIIVGIVILLALLVEDFIAFMQGRDSLFGELLKNAGIDLDGVRTKVRDTWENIKKTAETVWGKIKQFLLIIWNGLVSWWNDHGTEFLNGIFTIFNGVLDFISSVFMGDWKGAFDGIVEIAQGAIDALYSIFGPWLALIVGITAAILAYKAAIVVLNAIEKIRTAVTKGVTIAQQLMNAVMAANPIALIIMLVAGLVAAFIILWNKSEAFRNFFIGLWDGIKNAVAATVDFFINAWDSITEAFAAVGDFFKGVIDSIVGFFTGLWDSIKSIFNGIKDTIKNVFQTIVEIVKAPINWIIDALNVFINGLNKIKIPDWVPGIGGKGLNITPIARLEKGSGNTPDTFIAGDVGGKGGELVTGAKGRKVFTAAETGNVFGTLKAIAQMGLAANQSTAASAVRSVENKAITQNINIINTFNGDRAGQQKSSEAMDKASGDITSELARALAYAG